MKLIETTIIGKTVRMRYANDADPAKATEYLELQLSGAFEPWWSFVEIQRVALQSARELIGAEIQRTANIASQIPG